MSEKIGAALVGGRHDATGRPLFSLPLLFGSAAEAVCCRLPAQTKVYQLCAQQQAAAAGTEQLSCDKDNRFAALTQLPEYENVLVIDRPFVAAESDAVCKMVDSHLQTGSGVTLLLAHNGCYDAEGVPIACETQPPVCAVFAAKYLKEAAQSGVNTIEQLISAAVQAGAQKNAVWTAELIAISDGISAYAAQRLFVRQINAAHIRAGVHIFDMENTYIAPDAKIEAGAAILPACHIKAGCKIAAGAVIGPNSILEQAEIGRGTTVNNSQVARSTIGENTTVGPFAYVRPDCHIGNGCRVGDFVELKKAEIGNGTKVSHLTYIGDAVVGERVNFGCGTVVVNYDGYGKFQTNIGDDCFIGCNTNLVAPVTVGDRVLTAAGTTVTKDVPDGAMAIGRSKQQTMEGWNDRRRAAHEKK